MGGAARPRVCREWGWPCKGLIFRCAAYILAAPVTMRRRTPRILGASARRLKKNYRCIRAHPESSFCSPTKQPTPQAEGGAWPVLSRDGCSRMWTEARRALPRLTTRRPFLGGGVGWEAAAGGRVSTARAGRTSKNIPRGHKTFGPHVMICALP
eukprot:scaffold13106_cov174-Isochrysis_galbana.AAC.1